MPRSVPEPSRTSGGSRDRVTCPDHGLHLPPNRQRTGRPHRVGHRAQGESIRTIVGSGMPEAPPYTTEPRYLVPAASPLVPMVIAPVCPVIALAGADTVMLPALALPS